MKFVRKLFIITMVLCMTTSCDKPNVLTDFSQTDTDEALYLEAKKKVDDREWDDAIDIINNDISAAYRNNNVEVKETLAGAYAGKCGLDFVSLVQNLGMSSSAKLMTFFMNAMKNQVVSPADCDNAKAVMDTIAVKDADQTLFYTILGMAKSGAWLRAKADQDNGGLGDGARDAGFQACKVAQLPDENVIKSIVGLGMVINNISSVSSKLDPSSVTDITNFTSSCVTALNAYLDIVSPGHPVLTTCDLSNETFVTTYKDAFRLLIDDGTSFGIGACMNPLFQPCACP
ncbi:hypothetical protein [Bdellovibrio sp. HCB2-146]|uniref:hypothetical protein n=1 Tax=Bdellovibrio sp. HCB2-146 TaxID=3394362 RepID=UPI0039BC56F9